MPLYKYIAKNSEGKTVKGVFESPSTKDLIDALREQGLIIVNISESKGKQLSTGMGMKKRNVKQEDIVVFSRQLATMINSGIPLTTALDILAEQFEKSILKGVILKVRDEIEAGKSLSDGLSSHTDVFSNLFVNMVKAGETSGSLDEILERVAVYLEKSNSLQRKVKSALVYPAVVSGMAVIITALLMIKVIPVFEDIYSGFDATLPTATAILIKISDIMRKYFLLVVIAIGVIYFAALRFSKTEKGRIFIDKNVLRLPIFGILLRKVAIAKFSRTFSTLLKSGVPILTCLDIVAKTAGNRVIEGAIQEVRSSIKEGETIAGPLKDSGAFPPMVVRMISVGEKTGQLDKMVTKISDFYDDQIDAAVAGLTSMIEPLIIAFLGIVIGGVVVCMFLPIFKLTTVIKM